MVTLRNRHAKSIARQTAEIALAAPQVVAHRVARMASAGATPSARDRKEFHLMGAEKAAAFAESWQAMALQTMQAQQALATSLLKSWWTTPWTMGSASTRARMAAQWQNAALGVVSKGITPIHRKATANAKRLARTK